MNYEEFSNLTEICESNFVKCFSYKTGEKFYIEPAFYTQLMYLKSIYPSEFERILKQMEKVVLEKKIVSFVYDFESPFYPVNNSIYLEISDITNPLHIFYEDKSRGSDYGD